MWSRPRHLSSQIPIVLQPFSVRAAPYTACKAVLTHLTAACVGPCLGGADGGPPAKRSQFRRSCRHFGAALPKVLATRLLLYRGTWHPMWSRQLVEPMVMRLPPRAAGNRAEHVDHCCRWDRWRRVCCFQTTCRPSIAEMELWETRSLSAEYLGCIRLGLSGRGSALRSRHPCRSGLKLLRSVEEPQSPAPQPVGRDTPKSASHTC